MLPSQLTNVSSRLNFSDFINDRRFEISFQNEWELDLVTMCFTLGCLTVIVIVNFRIIYTFEKSEWSQDDLVLKIPVVGVKVKLFESF